MRREVLDRTLILGRRHLGSVLVEFIDHYNHARPGIEHRRPCEPADVVPLPAGPVERRDRLGGIIHEYSRAADEVTEKGLTIQVPLPTGQVERRDRLGGIVHEYSGAA